MVTPPHGNRPRFQWVREPTFAQLTQLAHTIARRVGRLLEREGLLERDTEQFEFSDALDEEDPMPDLVGHFICYEMHSRSHLAAASVAGGNVIAQMSNFTAFGGHVAERYDLAMSRILAVSYRTPIVRSVNGDTAGWIDAAGRLQRLAPEGGPAAQCRSVALPNLGPTLFTQLGAWMAWVPGLLGASLLVLCGRWRLRRPRATRH